MRRRLSRVIGKGVACLTAAVLLASQTAQACTGIRLIAADGSVIHARTLEFGVDLKSEVILVPRGYARTGTTPDGKPGKTWNTTYASLGTNAFGLPVIVDGINERGLAVGLFYFPGVAKYQPYAPGDAGKTIAPWELGSYMLENFASVDEVKDKIAAVAVPAVPFGPWKEGPPAHYIVHDATGKSIVIEYVDGKLNVYDNPLGVLTNSPGFDWQTTNLRNYVNFSARNHPPVTLRGGVTLEGWGQGTGMLGLPGDFTPPSRFVRAVAFSQSVYQSKSGTDAVVQAFKILNQFDIPFGAVREVQKDGSETSDYTMWTSASDLKAKRFHFRTYQDSRIRGVDLMKQKLDGKGILRWSMAGKEEIMELGAPQ